MTTNGHNPSNRTPTKIEVPESVIEFPCDFPIKVMGLDRAEFVSEVVALILPGDPTFNEDKIEVRYSSAGRYVSLTCTVWATSQEQLDQIYRALTAYPHAKYVL